MASHSSRCVEYAVRVGRNISDDEICATTLKYEFLRALCKRIAFTPSAP